LKALVLAAGKGSRLAGAAGGVPKPLVDIGGTTPLEQNVRWIQALPLTAIWVNLHAGGTRIRARLGTSSNGIPIHYSYEPELLGTAGAWKKLEREWSGTSLVVYGDNLMRFDLGSLLATHRAVGTAATVALFDPAVHRNTGIGGGRATLRGGRITRFVEGGSHGLVNAGCYFIEAAVAERLPVGFLDFGRDVLPLLAAAGELGAHVVEVGGYCLGVDTPERLAVAREIVTTLEISS
jgi:mannose-1-phosphate guanylyltransferase